MRSLWRIHSAILIGTLFLLLEWTNAHSQRRNRMTYITRVDDPVIRTPSHRAHAHSSFDLLFTIHNGEQDVKFTLEPNTDIIPDGAVVEYLDEDGNVERREPIMRHEHRIYKGNSWLRDEKGWYWAGWARIVIHRDGVSPLFEGAFTLNHDAHHIQLRTNFLKTRHPLDPLVDKDGDEFMIVQRDSDVEQSFQTQGLQGRGVHGPDVVCSSDSLDFNTLPENAINQMILEAPKSKWGSLGLDNMFMSRAGGLTRRQTRSSDIYGGTGNSAGVNLKNSVGSTDGCPSTRMVALVGVATDCTYTGDFPSEDAARTNIINQLNSASDLYEKTFNITLGLSQLVMSKANCPSTAPDSSKWNLPCSNNHTIDNRLDLFSEWRGQRNDGKTALWMLLTTCETGSAVGLAWLGQLCKSGVDIVNGQHVTSTLVVARTSQEWKIMAHESAHMMGAVHDCTSDSCANTQTSTASMCCPLSASVCDANARYIMNPITSEQTKDFSPCTVGNICSAFKRRSVDMSCLSSNRNVTILADPECGNGIVEEGEECDCGGTNGCGSNQCCDPKTCKFKNNAVCDDANEDCCNGCQFAAANTICRASTGDCDPAEKCTGKAAGCPKDDISPDGTSCGNGLKCASGQCTSRDQQCETVMGRIQSNNDTQSCDDSSCILSCQSPELGRDVCLRMQQNFLDGTPCNGDGVCKNGSCSGASALGAVKSWIDKHRNVVIGVGAGVGALLLFSILSCCWSRCRRRRPTKNLGAYNHAPPETQWQSLPSRANGSYPVPPMANTSTGNRDTGGYPGHNPYQQHGVRYA